MSKDKKNHIIQTVKLRKIIIFTIILIIIFFSFKRLYRVSTEHLATHYDLGVESQNLGTIKSIQEKKRIYNRDFYGNIPFIITIYNPLYFYLTANLPQDNTNPFFTGRFVSLCSTLLMLLLFFFPGYSKRNCVIWPFSIMAVSWTLLIPTFLGSAVNLSPDMLALFFSGLSIILIEKYRNNISLIGAAFFGLLAFATKQNFLCATFASLLFLYFRDPRKALIYLFISAFCYAAFFFFVQKVGGDGYWFSTFLSLSKHPFFLKQTLLNIRQIVQEPMFDVIIICLSASIILTAFYNKDNLIDSPYLIYVEITFLMALITIGKTGGEPSYFLEFIMAALLWLIFFTRLFHPKFSKRYTSIFMVTFLLAFGLELIIGKPSKYLLTSNPLNQYINNNAPDQLRKEIKDMQPPNENFLVLNTNYLYAFFPKGYLNDPINYWYMWNFGILDPQPMIRAIENKYFSIILFIDNNNPYRIPALFPPPLPPGRWTSLIVKSLMKNYRVQKVGVFVYMVPYSQLPPPQAVVVD